MLHRLVNPISLDHVPGYRTFLTTGRVQIQKLKGGMKDSIL